MHTLLLKYVSGKCVEDVFDLLGCTHSILKCSVLYWPQVLVSGFIASLDTICHCDNSHDCHNKG